MFDPCISRQILLLAFHRGIKATRDHGYAVYSDFLWLADECDCVCLPQQNCGQKVWDAWNSWDSVLPIWPNTTSISALLISTSGMGRQTCKMPWKAQQGILFEMQRPFFFNLFFCLPIEHEYMLSHISRRYLLNHHYNQKPTSSISIITCDSLQSSTWHGIFRALIISSSVVWHFYKSAASKWWWCECFSVLDRLRNELLYLQLAASAPSFSQIMVKKWALFEKQTAQVCLK